MKQSAIMRYLACCVTHNTPIDRVYLLAETGADDDELESIINYGICDVVMSQVQTGVRWQSSLLARLNICKRRRNRVNGIRDRI